MGDAEHVVFKHLREGQDKYTYFMLTAAGGAVALAVNQTQGAALGWSQVPLGAAVLCWGLSFFCGARNLGYVNATLYANLALLRVESGSDSVVGQHPEMIQAASEGIRQAVESNSKWANRYAKAQFRLLVGGAVLYVVWHVLEMWLRTIQH
jgi:hypothetical protein